MNLKDSTMTCAEISQIKKDYQDNLKAVEHYGELIRVLRNTKLYNITLPFLHDVFQSGRFTGSKLLDIGSGPTVHNIASASAYFSDIVLSDFVEDNCQELRKWIKGQSELDWSGFFNIVAELEGYAPCDLDEGRNLLELRVRNSIKSIIQCDLLADHVLIQDQLIESEIQPPFDVIISLWCFEATAPSVDSYREILEKVSNLLRDGGGLVMSGFLNCGMWPTGDKQHHHLNITAAEVIKAVEDAGFTKIDFRREEKQDKVDNYLYDSLFCLAAMKQST